MGATLSWTDKIALETIKQLRDEFKVKSFVETGTFLGTNCLVHCENFEKVYTCEFNTVYFKIADLKFKRRKIDNIFNIKSTSPIFLKNLKFIFTGEYFIVYLDAHFYDPQLLPKDRWLILKELEALKNLGNCIIIVHDFDNGEFGHITYDEQSLNFALLTEKLKKVNMDFHYYTNTKCDIYTKESIKELINDSDTQSNLEYTWSKPEKTYRGILYCVPKKLNLKNYKLREL